MTNTINLTGETFGAWTVQAFSHRNKHKQKCWVCLCVCGNTKTVAQQNLRSGMSRSCGCASALATGERSRTHGATIDASAYADFPQSYKSWLAMRQRCNNPSNVGYDRYGGRGIRVCPAWDANYAAFLADVGEAPPGCSIDRIDPDGDYTSGNVRWATAEQQARNKRDTPRVTLEGRVVSVAEACEILGLDRASVRTMACRYQVSSEQIVLDFMSGKRKRRPRT